MSSFEQRLAAANNQVLLKQATGGYSVEVVDENLVPMVAVSKSGKSSKFPLEKIGLYWSDGDEKFRCLESDDEVRTSELADRAIEAHLFRLEEGK